MKQQPAGCRHTHVVHAASMRSAEQLLAATAVIIEPRDHIKVSDSGASISERLATAASMQPLEARQQSYLVWCRKADGSCVVQNEGALSQARTHTKAGHCRRGGGGRVTAAVAEAAAAAAGAATQ